MALTALIVSGHADLADVFFLIAVVLFVVDIAAAWFGPPRDIRWPLIAGGLAFTAAGLLVL